MKLALAFVIPLISKRQSLSFIILDMAVNPSDSTILSAICFPTERDLFLLLQLLWRKADTSSSYSNFTSRGLGMSKYFLPFFLSYLSSPIPSKTSTCFSELN